MAKIGFYWEVDITECLEMIGRPPISTRWVDVNKGSTESPDVRYRLVARDFKPEGEKDRSDIFAAMPSLEAKKLLFRKAVGGRKDLRIGGWCQQKIMLIDVKKVACCRQTGSASRGSDGGSDVGCTAGGQPRAVGRNTTRRPSWTWASRVE